MKLFNTNPATDQSSAGGSLDLPVTDNGSEPIRRGPPNRMNDLPYRDWMKFQKSFFRHTTDQNLVEEFIYFFTKAVWPSGAPSRSLVVGVKGFDRASVPEPRVVDTYCDATSAADIAERLHGLESIGEQYDFILIDLRSHIRDRESLSQFLGRTAIQFYKSLRRLLVHQRYCTVLVGMEESSGGGFPLPWSVALSSRDDLRLRDEKIGLVEGEGKVYYSLVMQAEEEARPSALLTPENLCTTDSGLNIPAWLIPKPPPRKKHEVLHPAKYPETLVAEFLEIFTKPGDTVCDPMVGSGSTVVAAVQTRRNGVGIDLSPEFAQIAERRVRDAFPPSLFEEMESTSVILQGDSTCLSKIPELTGVTFDYSITSPPYWSMLTNPGSENQENRRKKNLPLVYSESEHDLGNVADYDEFLNLLDAVYSQVAEKLADGRFLTVVVKNVKRNHILYPLAWDLTMRLCGEKGKYDYAGTTLWCQDDVGLKPFAVGIHWVSNILHHYCLHFRKRRAAAR